MVASRDAAHTRPLPFAPFSVCAMVLVTTTVYRWEPAAPAFFSFLPVVFLQMARTIARLTQRIEELERSRSGLETGGDAPA